MVLMIVCAIAYGHRSCYVYKCLMEKSNDGVCAEVRDDIGMSYVKLKKCPEYLACDSDKVFAQGEAMCARKTTMEEGKKYHGEHCLSNSSCQGYNEGKAECKESVCKLSSVNNTCEKNADCEAATITWTFPEVQ